MAKKIIINGQEYETEKMQAPLASDPSQMVVFPETSDATAKGEHILAGYDAYVNGEKIPGSMPDRGAVTGEITTKDGDYTIQKGGHNGSGKVGIAAAEKAKIIPENIKAGATILGVEGDGNVVDTSDGDIVASDLPKGKRGYSKGAAIDGTGTYPSITLANGVLTIS